MPQQRAFYLHPHLHLIHLVRLPEHLFLSLPITILEPNRSRELAGLAPGIPVSLAMEHRGHPRLTRMASRWSTAKALSQLKRAFVLTAITGCMILADGA